MFEQLKQALAPGTASFAINSYYGEKYVKSVKRFERAERWWPGIISSEPMWGAYYALALVRSGREEEGIARLRALRDDLHAFIREEPRMTALGTEVDSVLEWASGST